MRLLLLLLLPFFSLAQSPAHMGIGAGNNFRYTDIPNADVSGSTATLTFSSPGNILNTTGGTTDVKYLSGEWNEFHAFSFTGSDTDYRRIVNLNSSTVIGGISNNIFTPEGTGSNYFSLLGLSPSAPMYFLDRGSVSATSAIAIFGLSAGRNVRVSNIVNNSRGYGVFANSNGTLSGGNSTTPPTSSNNYGNIDISFVRSFNIPGNQEHFYLGATTTTTYAIHNDLHFNNVLGYTSGWDCIQIQNATDFTLTKGTFVNGGTANTGSQNAALQVQNSYGEVTDCIFMDTPQGLRFSTLDLVFRNNYVHWTGNLANQIISYYGNYNTSSRLMVTPGSTEILIDDCDFVATTWTGALFQVFDNQVTIRVQNCRIYGATSLFDDDRTSPTGSLIDGGGNTFSAVIPEPTFTNFTPTDFEGHGLLTNYYHYYKRRGYRTP